MIQFKCALTCGFLLAFLNTSWVQASTALAAPVDANIFVNLSKKVVPSVVNISTLSTVKNPPYIPGGPDDILKKFFGDLFRQYQGRGGNGAPPDDEDGDFGQPGPQNPLPPQSRPQAMSLGTGFIIDSSGLILTNNHVVAEADEIKIKFTEDTEEKPVDGEVVGRDTELDLALIRVKTKRDLISISFGDSDALEVGEYVMAIGNPFGQGHSVTHGIISAKGRLTPDLPLAKYIQTDAPINPGNSGGPLVNLKGEVIGINNAIDVRAQGIGFAIPVNVIKNVLPQLKTKGTVSRGYIGVFVEPLSPEIAAKIGAPKDLRAPFVINVNPGEPADTAGIKPYDVILEFAGKPVHNSSDLITSVTSIEVGHTAPVKILRAGKEMTLTIKVTQRPGAPMLTKRGGPDRGKKKEKKPSHVNAGMSLEDITPQIARDLGLSDKSDGVVVSQITYGGPADKAGLMRGDVILEADRKHIKNVDSFYTIVKEKKSYLLRVRRADPRGGEAFAVIVLDLKT